MTTASYIMYTSNCQEYVFCLAKTPLQDVNLGDGEASDFEINDVFVARYNEVRNYVFDDVVQLI